jgi:REP element-mobilizing transposase RayT
MRTSRRQLDLRFHPRGGKRRGAGRKPNGDRAGVSHLLRPQFARPLPVHVTLRMARHVYNLRSRRSFSRIGRAIARAAERFGVCIVLFSVQGNHIHLVVEAADTTSLSRAMQGFSIRVAKGMNRVMNRRGRVLADRYHARPLRTPTEVRRAVAYVRENHRKHMAEVGTPVPRGYVDPYASPGAGLTLPHPRTWLLRSATSPPS